MLEPKSTIQQSLTFMADGTMCKSHSFSFVGERGSDSFGCSQGQCQVKYVCFYEGFWHAFSLCLKIGHECRHKYNSPPPRPNTPWKYWFYSWEGASNQILGGGGRWVKNHRSFWRANPRLVDLQTLLSSVSTSNSLVSVSDPWRAFWADKTPFKGPRPKRIRCCFKNYKTTKTMRHGAR